MKCCMILRSLERVFVFEFVKCLCIGAPSKNPAQRLSIPDFGVSRETRETRGQESSQVVNHNKGVTLPDASERKKEQQLIAANQYPRKILQLRAPKGRPSPQDMQEERDPTFCCCRSTACITVYIMTAVRSLTTPQRMLSRLSDHCEHCCPFPPYFSQVSLSLEQGSPS